MADFGVYWPFFSNKSEAWPVDSWRVGAGSRLADLASGDRLWLFTSGRKCKRKMEGAGFTADAIAENAGYLAQILTVSHIVPDTQDGFALLVVGKPELSPKVCPPLLIDGLIRPEGRDASVPIGQLRQAPWKLAETAVESLQQVLRRERVDISQIVFGLGG